MALVRRRRARAAGQPGARAARRRGDRDCSARAPIDDVLRERDRPPLVRAARPRWPTRGDGGEPWSAHVVDRRRRRARDAQRRRVRDDARHRRSSCSCSSPTSATARIAATLQRALLPERLPTSPGVSLAAHISPGGGGTRSAATGTTPSRCPAAGSASSWATSPATASTPPRGWASCASVARAYALEGHEPGRAGRAHERLPRRARRRPDDDHVFAILEIDAGTLRFVNAGHPPPLIVDAGRDDAASLEGAGPPLGVLDTWRYEERVATLAPGCRASSTPTAWSSAAASGSTTGLARLRDAAAAAAAADASRRRRAAGLATRRPSGRRRRDAGGRARRAAAGRVARLSSRPTPTRSRRCGACCAAGCARRAPRPTRPTTS